MNNYSIALFGVVLLYMIISLSGGFLAITIIEEKSGRIMEVLLSSVSPKVLLLGKILGVLAFSFTQFLSIFTTWLLSSIFAGAQLLQDLHLSDLAFFTLWFMPAILGCSFIYGGLGALISRSEDSGAIQGPMSVFLIGTVYLAVYGISNPEQGIVKVSTFIPPLNYFVTLGQILYTGKFTQSLLIGYVIALLFTCATIYFAISMFDANLLSTGRFSITKVLSKFSNYGKKSQLGRYRESSYEN